MPVPQRKRNIVNRLCTCFTNFSQVVVVGMDNVSTNQIHSARLLLRQSENKGEMIVGKNSLITKALKFMTKTPESTSDDYEDHSQWTQDAKLEALYPFMKFNFGLIFSEESYQELRKTIESQIISMPPRTGVIAPCDVYCPAGPTGIDVGKIDLFHKLNIGCKTVKSAIEVVKEIKIISKGKPVGEGATRLCKLLNIVPFDYKLEFLYVYKDGAILDKEALDSKPEDLIEKFKDYAGYLLGASLGAGLPNALSVPHFIANGFKSLLALGAESGYEFKQLKDLQDASKNAVSNVQVEVKEEVKEVKKEEKKEEVKAEEEEDDDDFALDAMFD